MTDELYGYMQSVSVREHRLLSKQRAKAAQMAMSAMQATPEITQLLTFLLQVTNARRIIELGVFTGYTTLAMALSSPEDAQIIACDVEDKWTTIGREYWREAQVEHKIDLRIAPAIDTLNALLHEKKYNFFDLIFIDADKENYINYYELSLQLVRPGGLILIDNVLWGGSIINPKNQSADVLALRLLNARLLHDRRISLSMLHVGDGITLIRKNP